MLSLQSATSPEPSLFGPELQAGQLSVWVGSCDRHKDLLPMPLETGIEQSLPPETTMNFDISETCLAKLSSELSGGNELLFVAQNRAAERPKWRYMITEDGASPDQSLLVERVGSKAVNHRSALSPGVRPLPVVC